jgi:hypothetical protein
MRALTAKGQNGSPALDLREQACHLDRHILSLAADCDLDSGAAGNDQAESLAASSLWKTACAMIHTWVTRSKPVKEWKLMIGLMCQGPSQAPSLQSLLRHFHLPGEASRPYFSQAGCFSIAGRFFCGAIGSGFDLSFHSRRVIDRLPKGVPGYFACPSRPTKVRTLASGYSRDGRTENQRILAILQMCRDAGLLLVVYVGAPGPGGAVIKTRFSLRHRGPDLLWPWNNCTVSQHCLQLMSRLLFSPSAKDRFVV